MHVCNITSCTILRRNVNYGKHDSWYSVDTAVIYSYNKELPVPTKKAQRGMTRISKMLLMAIFVVLVCLGLRLLPVPSAESDEPQTPRPARASFTWLEKR